MKKGKENLSDPYVVWYYKREQRIEAAKVVIAALFLVVCVCALLFGGNQPTQEQEPQQQVQEQERIASDFLHEKAQERAQKIDEIYGPGAYGGTDWLNGE